MALSVELEALITELEKVDAAGAKEQRVLLEKFPSLQKATQEQRLRQSDYDKFLNEKKALIDDGVTMRQWEKQNRPKFEQMQREREEFATRAEKAEKELTEKIAQLALKGGESGKVDIDQLTMAVKSKLAGEVPTKSELEKVVNAEAKKLVEGQMVEARKAFYDVDVPRLGAFNAAMTEAQQRFHDEFGEYLDAEKFTEYLAQSGDKCQTDGRFDRKKAYDLFVTSKRESKDFERRVKEDSDKRLAEALKARGIDGSFPGTSGPSGPGPLQMRFNQKDKADPLFGAPMELGDGSAAAQAAAELHGEGK